MRHIWTNLSLLMPAALAWGLSACRTSSGVGTDSALMDSTPGACIFGETSQALLSDPEFVFNQKRTIRADSRVSALRKSHVISGMKAAYGEEFPTFEAAVAVTDDQSFETRTFYDKVRKHRYVLYKYSGGDNPQGFIAPASRKGIVATISDDDVIRCRIENPGAPTDVRPSGGDELETLAEAVSQCAGNGNGAFVRDYEMDGFNVDSELRRYNTEYWESEQCSIPQDRTIHKNTEAVTRFISHMRADDDTNECLNSYLSSAERKRLEDLLKNPANKGVIATIMNPDTDNTEACSIWEIRAYMPNGKALSVEFNYTD